MNTKIPKRLRQEPLIEAIWQLHFEPAEDQPVADILPGVLFTALRENTPNLRLHRLPVADIPRPVVESDPNLLAAAKYRIESESADSPFIYQVGDRVVTLNCRKPYAGWKEFKAKVMDLAGILSGSKVISAPKRHALRYIDFITLEPPPSLSFLRLALTIGEQVVRERPLQIRVELPDEGCQHVLQIVTPANVNIPDTPNAGTIIDLETRAVFTPAQALPDIGEDLETLHTASKRFFFTQVLTEQAIEQMDPEY